MRQNAKDTRPEELHEMTGRGGAVPAATTSASQLLDQSWAQVFEYAARDEIVLDAGKGALGVRSGMQDYAAAAKRGRAVDMHAGNARGEGDFAALSRIRDRDQLPGGVGRIRRTPKRTGGLAVR